MIVTSDTIKALAAEFPRSSVSWRAQNIKKDGTSALALAYIDARDVMDRLDEAVGPENWSDSYEVHEHVTICSIAIRTADGWVSKSDGAGDTDVEAEKGRLSDALKRAAVHWGIGRYLYGIGNTWVNCECQDTGKKDKFENVIWRWKRWTEDPWSKVKGMPAPSNSPVQSSAELPEDMSNTAAKAHWKTIADEMYAAKTLVQLQGVWTRHYRIYEQLPENLQNELSIWKDELKGKLMDEDTAKKVRLAQTP